MRKGMEQFINNPIYTITAEAMSNGRDNIEVVGNYSVPRKGKTGAGPL